MLKSLITVFIHSCGSIAIELIGQPFFGRVVFLIISNCPSVLYKQFKYFHNNSSL